MSYGTSEISAGISKKRLEKADGKIPLDEYQNMFDDFNVPALDKAASEEKTIRFTYNPELKEYAGSFTDKEWKHLQEKWGYLREEGGFWYAEK